EADACAVESLAHEVVGRGGREDDLAVRGARRAPCRTMAPSVPEGPDPLHRAPPDDHDAGHPQRSQDGRRGDERRAEVVELRDVGVTSLAPRERADASVVRERAQDGHTRCPDAEDADAVDRVLVRTLVARGEIDRRDAVAEADDLAELEERLQLAAPDAGRELAKNEESQGTRAGAHREPSTRIAIARLSGEC